MYKTIKFKTMSPVVMQESEINMFKYINKLTIEWISDQVRYPEKIKMEVLKDDSL